MFTKETNTLTNLFLRGISLTTPCVTYTYITLDNQTFVCIDEKYTIKYHTI
jgi:hypothetical protein